MVVSYADRFLFVHIPRTAGTSIEDVLQPYAHRPQASWLSRVLSTSGLRGGFLQDYRSKRFRKHATARQVQLQLPEEVFRELFKFAFVRNPWDLMVSYYHYIVQTPEHHRHKRVAAMRSFEVYLRYEVRRNKFSQTPFLTDRKGNLLVDFVGRFESLREDLAWICQRLGINGSLRHINGSRHRDYHQYYNERTADLVASHFREDIQRFGYAFDEPQAIREAA